MSRLLSPVLLLGLIVLTVLLAYALFFDTADLNPKGLVSAQVFVLVIYVYARIRAAVDG